MGRIKPVLPVEDIVSNAVDTYIKDATVNYPSFLDSAPVLITYYSRAAYKSTHDTSFESFNEIAGDESPNRYHKIEKLPVYNLDTSDFGTDITENGIVGEVTSSFTLLPDTVSPKAEDLIEIELHTQKYLFVVTGSTPDNFGNNKFYKVSIRLSSYRVDEVNRQVDKELAVDFNSIGKKSKVVYEKTHIIALNNIRDTFDELLKTFGELYFSKASQLYVDKNQYSTNFNPLLNFFILDNKLNVPFFTFRNSNVINPSLLKMLNKQEYSKSFLSFFAKLDFVKLDLDNYPSVVVRDPIITKQYAFNYFLSSKLTFVKEKNAVAFEDILETELNFAVFKSATAEDVLADDPNLLFINKFLKFLRDSSAASDDPEIEFDLSARLDALLLEVDNIEVRYFNSTSVNALSNTDYYITPLLLFILKHLFYLLSNT